MTELTRTLRFCPAGDRSTPRRNAFAAWPPPSAQGLAGVVEWRLTLAGTPDPVSGLLVNVKEVDAAFAGRVLPGLDPTLPPAATLADALSAFAEALPAAALSWHPGPASSLARTLADMTRVTLRQQFTFSAAHRLVSPRLSDAENEALFGKCHRPSFHGHNYRLEVVAAAAVDAEGGSLLPADLDAVVDERVIDALDHRNLNLDVPAFRDRNPTVEHIAQTCFERLDGHLPGDAQLVEVTVWETDRTACTFRPG